MLFDKTHNLLLRINLKVVEKKKKIRNNIMYLISDKKKKVLVINSLYSHKFLIDS